MSTIVLRSVKGVPLTNTEVDNNFTNLNTDKYQSGSVASFTSVTLSTALAVNSGGTGVTTSTGTGDNVLSTSPTLITPALGTPSALVGTNITGTASGLSIGGNAATATNPASGGTFITSSNIGSQSVSFATSATNATNATNSTYATSPASGGTFITSSNIGSQSVSFATSSTNATNATNASNLSGVITGTAQFQSNLGSTSGSLVSPPLQVFATGGNSAFMSFHRSGAYAINMGFDSDNILRIGGWSAPANLWQLDTGGNNTVLASSRAPIFYDSNNTAYYSDPNGNSVLTTATFNANASSIIYITSAGTNASMIKAGAGDELYIGGNDTSQMRFSGGNVLMDNGGYFQNDQSIRSPIFYDSNNTAYYGDFASTSNLNALTIANGINNSSSYVNNGQLGLYNASYGGYFYQTNGTEWNATFNGNTNGSLILRTSYNGTAKIQMYYDSGASGLLTNTGNWGVRMNYDGGGTPGGTLYGAWTTTTIHTATQDMRAPLFYDTDTSYYGDFASTSRFNVVNATVLRSYENIYTDSNYGYGHVGVYASTRYQGIFAMADAYKLPADGTTTGNLYGIAWSHPNAGGAAGNLASHGMLILENGTFRGAWGGGSLRTTSNVYSPIYYDYDNPAYYLDPTGDSVLTTATFNANASSIIYITNGGTNASMIKAGAGDELYIGGNNTSQMRFSGGNVLMDNGGYFQNDQSIRSPIFYDTNTGYYWNLDGASNIGTVVSGTAQFLSNINTSGGTSNTLQAYSNNGGGAGMAFHRSGAYAVNFGLDSDNVMRIGGWSAPSNRWQLDMSGNNTVAGYMSSTIYYDNPNSSYYLDADSTSNLYNLNINGTNSKYLRITSTNSQEAMVYYEGGTGTQWYVGKRITAQLVSTADFHWYNVANNDTMMGLTVAGELLTRGGMYAPIFYDRDNPAYYVNPATTSNLDVVYANAFYGAINGMARDGNLINGMGPSTTWDPRPSVGYSAWSINYHTGIALSGHPSYGGVRLYSGGYPTHASSVLRLEASTGVYTYGPFTNDNSITAPIFYDTNTTYYMNINGTSNVDTIGAFALNTYNLTSQNAYTNNMDTTSSIGNGGMIRVLGQVGTNWTQILMSRPGVADSAYFFASDAWGPNGNAATEWLGCMSWTGRSLNATGTINASGSDYAEYMTKAGDFTIAKGDICGVDVNGKLTNVFTDAISFVVKSTKPSYVGGDEWGTEEGLGTPVLMRPLKLETETDEVYAQRLVEYEIEKPIFDAKLEAARQKVDRIAFSGQVPVNVTGAVSGQYIVPVNDNGAIKGIAINEDDLTMSQYIKSVGKVIKVVNGKPTIIVKVA